MGNVVQMRQQEEPSPGKIVPMDQYRTKIKGHIDLFSLDERISYLKKYGSHCMSFSTLQRDLHYFDIPGMGYIAFMEKWGNRLTLSDPVCDPRDRETFLREVLKDHNHITFVQLSQDVAELLHKRFGLYTTQFGSEILLDIEHWDLKGKKKQILRTSVNHAKSAGVTLMERDAGDEGCRQLTNEWLKTRKVRNREICFLIRPMDMDYQEGTRRFFAYLDGELIGFVFFDPIYRDGKVISYVPNISRFSNKFKPGIFYPLMNHAFDVFKADGIKEINLGLCPLVADDKSVPGESVIQKKMNRFLYNYGNWIFNFKGLYFTKSRFGGTLIKTFGAHNEMIPAFPFLVMFKLSNMLL
jgi:lysylphosphatidylglycerol synthetase-like protein (DUF2156 family)